MPLPLEAMGKLILANLPALPDDKTPHTDCKDRRVLGRMLDAIDAPQVVRDAAARYLKQASDRQLAIITTEARRVVAMLDEPEGTALFLDGEDTGLRLIP